MDHGQNLKRRQPKAGIPVTMHVLHVEIRPALRLDQQLAKSRQFYDDLRPDGYRD